VRRRPFRALALLLLAPAAAAAFVPPGGFVLREAGRVARRRAGLTATWRVAVPGGPAGLATLRLERSGVRFDPDPPPPGLEVLRPLLAGDAEAAALVLSVEPHAVTLARFDGHVAVTVGAARRGDAGPQLWIDHERFVPLRALAGPLDIRLLDTAGLLSTAGLPARVEVWLEGRLVWTARLAAPPRRSGQ